jgi:hypothetical protein
MQNRKKAQTLEMLRGKYDKTKISPSFLRLEKPLGTDRVINFDVTDATSALNNEVRLKQSDKFTVTEWGLFIYKTLATPTPASYSQSVLYTYPNNTVFTGTNEAAYLQSIYNGYMSLKVGQTTYFEKYPTLDFLQIPTDQKGVGTSTYDATNNAFNKVLFDPRGQDSGFLDLESTVTFDGRQDINIALNRASTVDVSGTSSTNMIVLFMRGFLISSVN